MNIKSKLISGMVGAAMLLANFNCALAADAVTLPFIKVENNFVSQDAFTNAAKAGIQRTVRTYYSAYDGEAVKFDGDGLPPVTLTDEYLGSYIGKGMLKISGTTPAADKIHTVRNRALSLPLTLNSGTGYNVKISYITAYGNQFNLIASNAGQYFVGSTGQVVVSPTGWTMSTAEKSFTPTSNDVDISLLDWTESNNSFVLYIDDITVSDNSGAVVYSDDFENYAVAGGENPGGENPGEETPEEPDQPQPAVFGIKKVTSTEKGNFVGQDAFENVDEVRAAGTYYSPYDAEVVQFNYQGYDDNMSWVQDQKRYDNYVGQYMLKVDRQTPSDNVPGNVYRMYRALSLPLELTPNVTYTVKISHLFNTDKYYIIAANAKGYIAGSSGEQKITGINTYATTSFTFTPTDKTVDISFLDDNAAGSSGVMYIDYVEILDSNGNSVYREDFAPEGEHCVGNLAITDVDGNNIDNLSQVAGIKAKAEFTNTSQTEAKYMIMAAIYNADKKLVKVGVQNVTVPADSLSEIFDVTVSGAVGEFAGCTAKAFVWNESLSPKCAMVTK